MTPIDQLEGEELRDALAVAAGWTKFEPPIMGKIRFARAGENADGHPIPPLDNPAALGAIARLMPSGWYLTSLAQMFEDTRTIVHPSAAEGTLDMGWCAFASPIGNNLRSIGADGPTETIARARLVLKVIDAGEKTP